MFARQGGKHNVCKRHISYMVSSRTQDNGTRNLQVSDAIVHLGFTQSRCNYFLFTKKVSRNLVIVLVYVDDLRVIGSYE